MREMESTAVSDSQSKTRGAVAPTLEALFGSRAEVRILGYLIDSTEDQVVHRQYDIADAIEMSEATVSRTIRKFRDAGIVEQTADGVTLSDAEVVEALVDIAVTVDVDAEQLEAGRFEDPEPIDADDPAYSYSTAVGTPNPTGD
jgi:DNA-binding transcriptional ArsR family regulator